MSDIGNILHSLREQRDDARVDCRNAEATRAEIAKILGAPEDADLVAFARARMQEVARAEQVLREYGPGVSLQEFTRRPVYSAREAGLPGSVMCSADAIRELARQHDGARRESVQPLTDAQVQRLHECAVKVAQEGPLLDGLRHEPPAAVQYVDIAIQFMREPATPTACKHGGMYRGERCTCGVCVRVEDGVTSG